MLNLTFEQKMRLYDIIIWGGVVGIVIWLILKIVGVIKTPWFITYLPVFFGIVSFCLLLVKLGAFFGTLIQTINQLQKDMHLVKKDLSTVKKEQQEMKKAIQEQNHAFSLHLHKFHS